MMFLSLHSPGLATSTRSSLCLELLHWDIIIAQCSRALNLTSTKLPYLPEYHRFNLLLLRPNLSTIIPFHRTSSSSRS